MASRACCERAKEWDRIPQSVCHASCVKRKGGEEIGTKEKKRTKREIVTKESDTVMCHMMGWTRAQGGKSSWIRRSWPTRSDVTHVDQRSAMLACALPTPVSNGKLVNAQPKLPASASEHDTTA
jgi:hypothetical protein